MLRFGLVLLATARGAPPRCPSGALDVSRSVRLATYVVSRRRDESIRDTIRETWCDVCSAWYPTWSR